MNLTIKNLTKTVLFFLVMVVFTTSCSTSKVATPSKRSLKGYWNLNTVTYSESGIYYVNLFNDVSSECMVGSSWRFIPNNNTGNYNIQVPNCNTGERHFVWSVDGSTGDESNYDILLKPTDEKNKSETNKGFRLQVSYLSESAITLRQTVQSNGKPFTITMNFTKNIN